MYSQKCSGSIKKKKYKNKTSLLITLKRVQVPSQFEGREWGKIPRDKHKDKYRGNIITYIK